MGVKSLKQLIKSKAPELFQTINLNTFAGKVIAVDTSIFLYRFMYTRGDKFLDLFVRQVLRLYKNNILPLFVFDGKPPAEKEKVIKERKEEKYKLKEKIDELDTLVGSKKASSGQIAELKKLKRKLIYVTKEDNVRCKKLLELMGVPYIVAKGEAEGLCVKLSREGYVEGCLSEDTDVLANGGKVFIRDFSVTKNTVVACYYKDLLKKLEVTEAQFRDICILCGCDYTEKIAGIGHVNAYKIIKKHGNIEAFMKECCDWVEEESSESEEELDGKGVVDEGVSSNSESIEDEDSVVDVNDDDDDMAEFAVKTPISVKKPVEKNVKKVNVSNKKSGGKKYKVGKFFKYKEARKLFETCGMEEDSSEAAKVIVIRKPNIDGILSFLKDIGSTLDEKTLNLIQNKLILNYYNIMQVMYDGGKLEHIVIKDYNTYRASRKVKKGGSPKTVKLKLKGKTVAMKDGSLDKFFT